MRNKKARISSLEGPRMWLCGAPIFWIALLCIGFSRLDSFWTICSRFLWCQERLISLAIFHGQRCRKPFLCQRTQRHDISVMRWLQCSVGNSVWLERCLSLFWNQIGSMLGLCFPDIDMSVYGQLFPVFWIGLIAVISACSCCNLVCHRLSQIP